MFFIDTHCHLDAETLSADLQQTLERAIAAGVNRLLAVGFDIKSSLEGIEAAQKSAAPNSPDIWAAVGVHPHEAANAGENYEAELAGLLKNSRVAALGEIGLDFYYDNSPRDIQREVFRAQIEIAKRAKKPIILHIRDAADRASGDANGEVLTILEESGASEVGGVVHCFSGNMKDAERALELGFYISFAGPVTYPKNDGLRKISAAVPLERILCETDSPYLAPQKFRGRKNEPANVIFVYEEIARARGMALSDFALSVRENADRLFKWEGSTNV